MQYSYDEVYARPDDRARLTALRDALATLPRGEIDEDIGTDLRMNAVEAQPRRVEEAISVNQATHSACVSLK